MGFPQCGEFLPQFKQFKINQNSVDLSRWLFCRGVLACSKGFYGGSERKEKKIFLVLVVFLFKQFIHLIQQNKKQHDRARIHSTYW